MEKCSQHQLLDWLMFSFPLECFSLHWSLVIICIPDKEDESGLTIIHLDSLGLHPRNLIFNNVKRWDPRNPYHWCWLHKVSQCQESKTILTIFYLWF